MTDATRMDLLATRSYTTRDGESKTAYTKIGVAFATKTGGWSLTFEALPVPSMNDKGQVETRVLMKPPLEGDAPPARPASGGYGGKDHSTRRSVAPAFDGDSDDIPFLYEWREMQGLR